MAITEAKKMTTLQVKRFKPSENPTNNYLTDEKGVWAWMTTVDHKKIGIMYLVAVAFFFALAGFLAIALRTELWTPAKTFIEADTYNQLFTLHGAMMVFLYLYRVFQQHWVTLFFRCSLEQKMLLSRD